MTSNLYTAYFYGNINPRYVGDAKDKYVCIFKLDVTDDDILPDYDELRVINKIEGEHVSVSESIELCGCVRVNHDISIKESEYMILPGTVNRLENEDDVILCRGLSELQLSVGDVIDIEEKIQKRFNWIYVE